MMLNLLLLAAATTILWAAVDFAVEGQMLLSALVAMLALALFAVVVITWGDPS